MIKKIDKKAFTLIEVLVVVAIVGILALLALPRFIGQTQKAELVRIQHDVKAMEKEIGPEFINGDDGFNKWENNSKDLNQLVQDKELFENEGVATEVDSTYGTYKVIPKEYKDKINTKLKGTFYINSGGKVYYEHGEPLVGIPTESGEEGPGYSDEEIQDLIKEGYIPVATADELNNVRSETLETYGKGTKWEDKYIGGIDKKYVQVANIDLSGYSEGGGWNPIGNFDSRFRGTYDGGNYVITDLEVKGKGKYYQGLFGYTRRATISNIGLIDNKVTGGSWTGGLVGYAWDNTMISNSYATGSVTGTEKVGGLVGNAYGGTISNSYATGPVEGTYEVGGLVGQAFNSMISNPYATGSVTGQYNVGGIVGRANASTIENSYATGSVTGLYRVGGLVGLTENGTTINNSYATGIVNGNTSVGGLVGIFDKGTKISNSYATGSVTGTKYVGGLVGYAGSNTIENSYWNKETTKQTKSAGGGEGKLTDEMMKQIIYKDWDFDTIWKIDEGNDYPKLR